MNSTCVRINLLAAALLAFFSASALALLASGQLIAEPVPEPATMFLFGAGIAGVAGIIRRRRMSN